MTRSRNSDMVSGSDSSETKTVCSKALEYNGMICDEWYHWFIITHWCQLKSFWQATKSFLPAIRSAKRMAIAAKDSQKKTMMNPELLSWHYCANKNKLEPWALQTRISYHYFSIYILSKYILREWLTHYTFKITYATQCIYHEIFTYSMTLPEYIHY